MLRSWALSTKTAYNVTSSLLNGNSNLFVQQTRTTYILKRRNKLRLYKKDATVHKLTRKDFFYDVVEDTDVKKKPPLDLILLQDVKEYGVKGQRISVKRLEAYNKLLLPKYAVYSTPENIEKYYIEGAGKDLQMDYSDLMAKILSRYCLQVFMSPTNPWELEKRHIRTNFRVGGVNLTDESIEMPKQPIRGPNMDFEGREFFVIVTINKSKRVHVRCRLYHINKDRLKYGEDPHFYMRPEQAIFPEDQEVLDSLPRPKWEDTWNKNEFL